LKSSLWDDGGYDFYLGPSIDNGVSDSISMNRYIDKICKELSTNINWCCWECTYLRRMQHLIKLQIRYLDVLT
jgi:hypothetical protein